MLGRFVRRATYMSIFCGEVSQLQSREAPNVRRCVQGHFCSAPMSSMTYCQTFRHTNPSQVKAAQIQGPMMVVLLLAVWMSHNGVQSACSGGYQLRGALASPTGKAKMPTTDIRVAVAVCVFAGLYSLK